MVDMLIKYINKDTTMTFGRVEHKDLTFPGLALCPSPGYKSAAVAEVSDLDDPWEYGGSGTVRNSKCLYTNLRQEKWAVPN